MAKKLSKQISLGTDPMTGKRIRKWIHADSKAGLRQAEKDALMQFARDGAPSSITYGKYEEKWFDAYCCHITPRTKAVYRSILKQNNPLHNKKMKDITRTDLQKVINQKWEVQSFCKKYKVLMRSIWKNAVMDNICTKDITISLSIPKSTKKARRPLTKEELTGIKKANLDASERFLMDVLLQFGLRPGEAFALNRQAFNRKSRTLTIDKAVSYDHEKAFIKSTKTGVTRVLPVPDDFWKKIPKCSTMYYFTDDDGQLLTLGETNKMKKSILDKINLAMGGTDMIRKTDMTMYNCRHHKASLLYYLPGVSIKKKAEYMGHSEAMFLKTYSHMMEEKEDQEVLRESVNL